MDTFTVTFEPPIPAARRPHRTRPKWPSFYAAAEAAEVPELDPAFNVAGRTFGYYPAHVSGVLDDLLGAADIISRREDQSIGLCGYTVLLVEFREGRVYFRDPAGSFSHGGTPIGDGFDPEEVEETLRQAADAVWELVLPKG